MPSAAAVKHKAYGGTIGGSDSSDADDSLTNASKPQTSDKSHFAQLVSSICTKIINVPVLTDNSYIGINGCLGSLALGSIDNNRRFQGNPIYGDPAICEILSKSYLRRKVVLNILDALIAAIRGWSRVRSAVHEIDRRDLCQPRSGRHRCDCAETARGMARRRSPGQDRPDRQVGQPCPQRRLL